jgi:GT2 family glycosyltransferase
LKQISFIIPLFNHVDETRTMLASLVSSLPFNLDYEIIFVDDYSTDGTREWLRSLADERIQTLFNAVNLGYAKSNNLGAQLASGRILGLLNNDLIFKRGWLEPMIKIIEAQSNNAGIVGNVQYRADNQKLDHAGFEINPRGQFSHIRDIPVGLGSEDYECLAVTGACVLIQKEEFVKVGGFDESYINGCEDVDLCYKLRAQGKQIYIATQSRIEHHISLSRKHVTLQNQRNSQQLYSKWHNEIVNELAARWLNLLELGPKTYQNIIDGKLSDEFLKNRDAAALRIAQCMVLREEYQWKRDLDEVNPNARLSEQYELKGLIRIDSMKAYLAEHAFELALRNCHSVRNFYVCGRKINAEVSGHMAITITVDQNQSKVFILRQGDSNINIGIVDPILSGQSQSRFKVKVDYVDDENNYIEDANKSILITHFVIDDQKVGAIS